MEDSIEMILEEETANYKSKIFKLVPQSEEACKSIFVNGQKCQLEGVVLGHNDRIIFGSSVFLFKNPDLAVEWYIKRNTDEILGLDINEDSKDAKLAQLECLESVTSEQDNYGIDWEFAISEKLKYEEKEIEEINKVEEQKKEEEVQKKIEEQNK